MGSARGGAQLQLRIGREGVWAFSIFSCVRQRLNGEREGNEMGRERGTEGGGRKATAKIKISAGNGRLGKEGGEGRGRLGREIGEIGSVRSLRELKGLAQSADPYTPFPARAGPSALLKGLGRR